MSPKVSIIIPAYNTEKYIAQALESVLEQTERDFEAIVIDDGSSDSTAAIVKNFTDSRIKLLVNDCNRGLRYSLNRGLSEAKGEWIALLDSDDWFASSQRISKLLEVAQLNDADIVADDIYFIDDGDEHPYATLFCVGEQFDRPKSIDAVTFLESNIKPAAQSPHYGLLKPIFKRSFLARHKLNYDESLWHTGDLHFYLMCSIDGARFILVPEAYYYYRRSRMGASSTSRTKVDRLEQQRQLCLLLLKQEPTRKNPKLVESLNKYLVAIARDINYQRIVQPIKEKGFLSGLTTMIRDPALVLIAIGQIPELLKRRIFQN